MKYRASRPALSLALLGFVLGVAHAQTTAPAPVKKAPVKVAPPKATPVKATPFKSDKTAAQILDGFIAATGGKEAYAKITSTQSTATLSIPTQNINGTITIYAKAPNKVYTSQDIAGLGLTEVAFDGTTGWQKDKLQGLRVLSGIELANLKRDANFNGTVDWRTLYPTQEVTGIATVDGKPAYVVRLTPAATPAGQGKPVVQYYDKESLLLVRTDSVQQSAQGEMPVTTYVSDYRVVDGVKVPFGGRIDLGPVQITTTITEVKNNVPIDDSKFAKPAN